MATQTSNEGTTSHAADESSATQGLAWLQRAVDYRYTPFIAIAAIVIITTSGYLLFSGPNATSLISVGPSDSSYTALAYARSIAGDQHFGFSPISDNSTTTGMTWVLLMVPVYLISDALSVPPMLLAKLVGILLLFAAGAAVFTLARITSNARWLAIVAVAPLLLEPRFVFTAVAGTEHALFAATIAWLLVFRMKGQDRLTTAAATVAVGIWPMGAFVFMAYLIDVTSRIRWTAPTVAATMVISPEQLALLRKRLVAPAVLFVVIAAITFFTDNGLLPSTFAFQSHPFRWGDWSNIWSIFTVHLSDYSPFDTPLFLISIAILLLGNIAIWQRARAISIVLLPVCFVYLYLVAGWRDLDVPLYSQWSLVALVWPLIAIPLGIGMTNLLTVSFSLNAGKAVAAQIGEPISRIAPGVIAILVLIGISSSWPTEWRRLPALYQQGAQATHALMIEPAEWLNENGADDDVVIAVQGNAIRATLDHGSVYDLTGGGSPSITRRPVNSVTLTEFAADWIVLWDDNAARTIPELEFYQGFTELSGSEYPLDNIAVWRSNLELIDAPPDEVAHILLDGLTSLGSFDIGDPELEFNANYVGGDDRFVYEWTSSYGRGKRLTESYSLQPTGGFDTFTLPAAADTPMLLAIRYDSTRVGELSIRINGIDLGTVRLVENSEVDSLAIVPVPASVSTSDQMEVEVGYESARTGELAILRYWTFVADESLVGRGPDVVIVPDSDPLLISDSFTDLDFTQSGLHFPDTAKSVTNWKTDVGDWKIAGGRMHESLGLDRDSRLIIEAPNAREISTDIHWQDDSVGIIIGYEDPQNWAMYYFFPDIQGFQEVRFGVMDDGIFTPTTSALISNRQPGSDIELSVKIAGDRTVTGLLDGNPVLTAQLADEEANGDFIGLMSRGSGNAFDNFEAHMLR